jgi:hypothetical protein
VQKKLVYETNGIGLDGVDRQTLLDFGSAPFGFD